MQLLLNEFGHLQAGDAARVYGKAHGIAWQGKVVAVGVDGVGVWSRAVEAWDNLVSIIQDLTVFANLNAANRAISTAVELADQVAAFPCQLVEVVKILEKFPVLAMVTIAVVVVNSLLQFISWDI